MLNFILSRLKIYIEKSDPLASEFWLYSIGVLLGIWLCNPFVNIFQTSQFFRGLQDITQWFGLISLGWGLAGTYALVYKVTLLKKLSAFVGALFWCYLSVYSLLYNPFYTSFPIFVWLTIQCTWLFFRLKVVKISPRGD